MKKTISMVMAFLMLAVLLSSCGSSAKNAGLTVDDFADSSATQQRWLRLEGSSLVVNPDEYLGNDSGTGNRMALNIGLLNEDGTVSKSLNDLIFILENASANGVGGQDIWAIDISDATANSRWGSKLTVTEDNGLFTAATSGSATQTINFNPRINIDLTKDIVALINASSFIPGATVNDVEAGWKIGGTATVVSPTEGSESAVLSPQTDTTEVGQYVYYLSDMIKSQLKISTEGSSATLNLAFSILGDGTSLTFSNYKVVQIDRGFHYADAAASTTWYPYGIKSALEYTNGTKVETFDYFANYMTVARKITYKAGGLLALAGKVDGTITYDEASNVMVIEGDGYKYVIAPKKKQDVEFYESEADMLARANATTAPTATTKYWTVSCGKITVDTDLFVAVSVDPEMTVDELIEATKKAVDAGGTDKRLSKTKEYWESYIHYYDLPNELITNVPQAKG